jgi:hypothetical protein
MTKLTFKKWAAQEAREGRATSFKKWVRHEMREKTHRGNPSFAKWAKQEMREKSHTRRRRRHHK